MSGWVRRVCLCSVALIAVLRAVEAPLFATVAPAVPEIDSTSLSAGLALLAAGILVVRSRRRSK
jgi:MYXO-CTERM domain-containing protein